MFGRVKTWLHQGGERDDEPTQASSSGVRRLRDAAISRLRKSKTKHIALPKHHLPDGDQAFSEPGIYGLVRLTVHSAELAEAEAGCKYFVVVSVGSQSLVTAQIRAPGTRERSRRSKAHDADADRGSTPSRTSTTASEPSDASAPSSTAPSASAPTLTPHRPRSLGNLSELTKLGSPRGSNRLAVDLRFESSARFILRRGGAVVARVAVYRAGRYRGTLKPELVAWCTIDLSRPFGEGPGEGASVADEAQSEVEGGSDLDEQEHAGPPRPLAAAAAAAAATAAPSIAAASVAARSGGGGEAEPEETESTVDLLGLGETSEEPVCVGSDEAQAAADLELSLQGLGTPAGAEGGSGEPNESGLHATASDLAESLERASDEIFGAVYGGSSGASDDQAEEEGARGGRETATASASPPPGASTPPAGASTPPAGTFRAATHRTSERHQGAIQRTSEEFVEAVEHPLETLEGLEGRLEQLPVQLASTAKHRVAARVTLPPRAAWHDARKMVASYRLVDPMDPLRVKGTLRVSAGASSTAGLDERMWRCLVGLSDRDTDGRVGAHELAGLLEVCGCDLSRDEREVFCEAVVDEAVHREAAPGPAPRAGHACPPDEDEDAFLRPDETDEAESTGESSSDEAFSADDEDADGAEDDGGHLAGLAATVRAAARAGAPGGETGPPQAPLAGAGAGAGDALLPPRPATPDDLAPGRATARIRAVSEALAALSRGDVLDRLLCRCPVDGSSLAAWPRVARVLYVCLALSEASASRGQHHMRGGYASAAHASRGWTSKAGEWLSQPLAGTPQALLLGNRNAAGGLRRGAAAAHILVYDRRSKVIVEERVPAIFSLAMRNMYQSTLGALLMREGYFSRLTRMSESKGRYMDSPESVHDIAPFVRTFKHEIDLTEVDEPPSGFKTFNEFFSRKLLPGARPVAEPADPLVVSSAADCRLMAYSTVQEATRFWVKGRAFTLSGLLGGSEEAALFLRGTAGCSGPAAGRREADDVAKTSLLSFTESAPQLNEETDVQVSQASAATAPGALGSFPPPPAAGHTAQAAAAAAAAAQAAASSRAGAGAAPGAEGRSEAPSSAVPPESSSRGSALGRWMTGQRSPRQPHAAGAPGAAQPALAIFRLAPQDYHRYHSPLAGTIVSIRNIPGALYTVNPIAVNSHYADVFTQNKRDVLWLDSPVAGLVAIVAVGATMVGSIIWTVSEGDVIKRGDELGTFAFGGSTIILVLPGSARVRWDADLVANGTKSIETLVRANERIGVLDI